MKIGIVSGSHRKNSQSEKISHFLKTQLKNDFAAESYQLMLYPETLPFWDDDFWENAERWKKIWSPISSELKTCDAIIIISPEWSGMAPAALKNFFLFCSGGELAHKPGLIVAVSSGLGGSYPVAELRMSSYKNTKLCYIPEHVIVRQVEKRLNSPETESADDTLTRERLSFALKMLDEYAKALSQVRESGATIHPKFPNGM